MHDLKKVLAAFSSLKDPTLHHLDGDDATRLRDVLLRMAGQQMPFQGELYYDLARTAALYMRTPYPGHRTRQHLTTGWADRLFGCSLTEYVAIAQQLFTGALTSNGRFDLGFANTPEAQRIFGLVSSSTIQSVLASHFTTDVEGVRAVEQTTMARLKDPSADRSLWRRFTYNPLLGKPAVRGYGDGLLVPVPQLLWRKASPEGIYFTGVEAFGLGFARETGYLFEEYIGRQLRLLDEAEVLPEIAYKQGNQGLLSVDWFVVFDDLVLLVEVKSMMPTEQTRLGLQEGVDKTMEKLNRAVSQIRRSNAEIERRNPAFTAIPSDRPRQGVVVTLEPFVVANSRLPGLDFHSGMPITVASASEIEALVSLAETSPSNLLLDRAQRQDQSSWPLDSVLAGLALKPNPIIDEGWRSYPWGQAVPDAVHAPPQSGA